jgi:hypothetical protein
MYEAWPHIHIYTEIYTGIYTHSGVYTDGLAVDMVERVKGLVQLVW